MGRWDHQGDRENGKRRFVPGDQGLLYLSFTVHYVNKKVVPRQYYACFYLLISHFEKLNLACSVKVRRKKANPKSPQPAFLSHFLHCP